MVYARGYKKKTYNKKRRGVYKKRSFRKAVINVAETKRRFEQVYDGVQLATSLNPVIISDINPGIGADQREGAKIFLKGIRIKGQFSRDAGQSAVPDYFANARIVVWFQSNYNNTGSLPTLSDLLINDESDASDMSAMIDTNTNKVKMDKRLHVDMSRNQIVFFDKYIPINKVHTYTTVSGGATTGKFGNWYIGIFGNGSDTTNLGFIDCETMLYYKDF